MSEVPVRVFIRIRPLLDHEAVHSSEECICLVSQDQLVLGQDRSFRFDRIFPHNESQAEVYEHSVSPLVSSCLEGYNATVFAYGQTGSGKSFTMGSETSLGYEELEQRGMIPRALEAIFHHISTRPDTLFTVCVSYIEIYKEELRDLLEGSCGSNIVGGLGDVTERGIHIREDAEGNTLVVGGTELSVSSVEEALGWLEVGNSARVTGATQMNQKSSRSHAIFTLHLRQTCITKGTGSTSSQLQQCSLVDVHGDNPAIRSSSTMANEGSPSCEVEQCLSAKFHFVDLAGSERASKTGNRGERFKESVHINSGLLALGNVISALGGSRRKSSHVPYRDSKITRILKDSLGGNSRTAMITCLSPAAVNFAESLNSLKYSKRARSICNRPVVNRDPETVRLHQMQEEIQSLRDELQRAQSSSKPVSAGTVMTVDSSLNIEPLSQISELEHELQRSREQIMLYQTSLAEVRDRVDRLHTSTGESGEWCSVEKIQRLQEWLKSLKPFGGTIHKDLEAANSSLSRPDITTSSPLSAKALQTIEVLRSELERCHVDLQTDEELFAEKMDEMADLQLNYSELMAEKERLEAMWLAAQESEGLLRSELEQFLQQLVSMESELIARDEIIRLQKELLESHPGADTNQYRRDIVSYDQKSVTQNYKVKYEHNEQDLTHQSNIEHNDQVLTHRSNIEHNEQELTHRSCNGQSNIQCNEQGLTHPKGQSKTEHNEQGLTPNKDNGPNNKSEERVNHVQTEEVETVSVVPLSSGFSANRSLLVGRVKTSSLKDFTEEAVLKSLRTLTQCLIDDQNSNDNNVHVQQTTKMGRTWTLKEPNTTSPPQPMKPKQDDEMVQNNEKQTHKRQTTAGHTTGNAIEQSITGQSAGTPRATKLGSTSSTNGGGYSEKSNIRAKTAPEDIHKVVVIGNLDTLQVQNCESETVFSDRPTTPIETSIEEPNFSKTNHHLHVSTKWKTEGVSCDHVLVNDRDGVRQVWGVEGGAGSSVTEMDVLNESAFESKKQLTAAEEKLMLAHDELKNLNLKIKLKEELIRELVKTGKSTKQINSSYLKKIQKLEQEVIVVSRELNKTQATLRRSSQQSSTHSDISADMRRTVEEQKKKLAVTERKLTSLQKKQKETQRLVQFGVRRERRVDELESGIERLKNQQEILKRKLKSQADKKIKLENDLQKYQHRMKMLQARTDQQTKVLRVKTEEVAIAQRKLRQLGGMRPSSQAPSESAESQWLDEEVDKILQQKQAMEALEKNLAERERVILEKEALITERDALDVKQLQVSQATARDIVHLSLQIDSIETSLKTRERQITSREPEGSHGGEREIGALKKERDVLERKCQELQTKMDQGSFLPVEDQRKLYELNEHIEILDAALDFKNSSIDSRQPKLNQIIQEDSKSSLDLKDKIKQLPSEDAHRLVERYVEKVIHLQLLDQQSVQTKLELEVEISDQAKVIRRLERSLKQVTAAGERQLLSLQKDHEQQVQFLVQQLAVQDNQPSVPSHPTSVDSDHTDMIHTLQSRVKQLEKDLYYYKKTSRELRRKLREETNSSTSTHTSASKQVENVTAMSVSARDTTDRPNSVSIQDVAFNRTAIASLPVSEQTGNSGTTERSSGVIGSAHAYGTVGTCTRSTGECTSALEDNAHSKIGSTRSIIAGSQTEDSLTMEDSLVSGGSGLEVRRGLSKEMETRIVKKHKKQLRQLSAKEISERRGHKDKKTHPT